MTALSPAIAQRRRPTPPDALDYFPTPPFATRALCEFLQGELGELGELTAWEPAAGEGHMVRPLQEYFGRVRSSDVFPYLQAAAADDLPELELIDFAVTGRTEPAVDLLATNPPFRLAQQFIETALQVADRAVAMLVRSAFLESEGRLDELYSRTPPSFVLQFSERVVMLEGRLVRKGSIDPAAAKPGTKASTATAYCWLVWLRADRAAGGPWDADTRLRWIAPAFNRLERAGDYPAAELEALPPPEGGLFCNLESEGAL